MRLRLDSISCEKVVVNLRKLETTENYATVDSKIGKAGLG